VTGVLLLAARLIEGRSFAMYMLANLLDAISAAGTIALMIFAFRAYWRARSSEIAGIAIGLACYPFLIGWMFAVFEVPLNVHGAGILVLALHGFLLETTAVILLASIPIRAFIRSGQN